MRWGLRAPLAALLLAAVLLPATAGAPPDVEAVGPLPDCRLDDITTVPRAVNRLGARVISSLALAAGLGDTATQSGALFDVKYRVWRQIGRAHV